jgi:hypothetical protein
MGTKITVGGSVKEKSWGKSPRIHEMIIPLETLLALAAAK